ACRGFVLSATETTFLLLGLLVGAAVASLALAWLARGPRQALAAELAEARVARQAAEQRAAGAEARAAALEARLGAEQAAADQRLRDLEGSRERLKAEFQAL